MNYMIVYRFFGSSQRYKCQDIQIAREGVYGYPIEGEIWGVFIPHYNLIRIDKIDPDAQV